MTYASDVIHISYQDTFLPQLPMRLTLSADYLLATAEAQVLELQ